MKLLKDFIYVILTNDMINTLFGYSPRMFAGIAECGNVLGLIGVISICSVQLVSR